MPAAIINPLRRTKRRVPSLPIMAFLLAMAIIPLTANANVELDPYSELILDLRLEGQRLGIDILGYQHDGDYFVSLSELVDSLQFPIKVDADAGLAGGWYISEEREFSINISAGQVISGNRTFNLEPDKYAIKDNDLFIETDTLETWLPLELQTVIRELTLNVKPTEEIPLQARLARMNRGPISLSLATNEPRLPALDDPYRFIGHRGTDLRLGYTASRSDPDADTQRNYNYSMLSRGDLGWMTSTFSASGTDSDSLNTARLTLERTRFEGPLELNHVEIGDVRSGGGNRGILVRGGVAGNQYQGQFADNTIPIRGNILPDWEVELYRNGVLIDFQIVGDDGRYNFPQVPLVYGENIFELRFYGPFGEERTEQVTHYVGEGMFGLGSFSYELSATQAEQTLLGLEEQPESEDQGTGIYTARASIGIARGLTATGSLDSFQREGSRLESYSAGLSLSAFNAQTNTSYRYNPESLDTATASVSSRTGFVGWSASYQHFLTDRLEPSEIPDNRTLWQSGLSLNLNQFVLPFNINLRHSEQELTETSSADLDYTARLPYNSRFSQSVAWVREDQRKADGDLNHYVTSGISLSAQSGPWNLRLSSSFFIEPETDLASLSGSARLRVDRSMAMTFDARYLPSIDTTSYSAGYNWLFETLMLSPRVSYDTNERWGGAISISTSFGSRPYTYTPHVDRLSQTDHGGVASRVFLDRDGNGVFDPGDQPIPEAKVMAPQGFRSSLTNERGIAYLPRLSAYRDTDIILDPETLPELDMTSTHAGNSVTPRPGHWNTIDFPVIRTMELEGTITRVTQRGNREPAGRVTLELVDENEEVVSRQRTAFDGMFIYTDVPPGNYRLRLANQTDYDIISGPGAFKVSSEGGVVRDLDFLIRKKETPTESLIPQQPETTDEPEEKARPDIIPLGFEPIESSPLPPLSFDNRPVDQKETDAQSESSEEQEAWLVQFGAFGQRGNAINLWDTLKNEEPDLFNARDAIYREMQGRGLTALMTVVEGNETDARAFCAKLESRGYACIVKGKQ